MFRPYLLVLAVCVLTGTFFQKGLADEPQEVWLKTIEGTWTWDDDDRGKVTVTFKPQADGKCVVGMGKDDSGSFVSIIGWEAWSKSLTDTALPHLSSVCFDYRAEAWLLKKRRWPQRLTLLEPTLSLTIWLEVSEIPRGTVSRRRA